MVESQERHVTLSEVKHLLEVAEKDREELTYEQKLALEHARTFARFSKSDVTKLLKDLRAMEKIDSAMAIRICDLAPGHPDDVVALFAKSRINLDEAEVQNILETVAKYLGD